jgi:hypothetical protein
VKNLRSFPSLSFTGKAPEGSGVPVGTQYHGSEKPGLAKKVKAA